MSERIILPPNEVEIARYFRETFSGDKGTFVLSVILDDLGFFETEPRLGESGEVMRAFAARLLSRMGINHQLNKVVMVQKLLETPSLTG